jgi:hypothetical protein
MNKPFLEKFEIRATHLFAENKRIGYESILIRSLLRAYQPNSLNQFIVQYLSQLKVIIDLDCLNQSQSRQNIF